MRAVLYLLVKRIRTHWPKTAITIRGDSHYGRPEAMAWCEKNRISYVFGIAGNPVMHANVARTGLALAASYAHAVKCKGVQADKVRGFAEFSYGAESWDQERRIIARIEASDRGVDNRYVATNVSGGTPEDNYAMRHCAHGWLKETPAIRCSQRSTARTSKKRRRPCAR